MARFDVVLPHGNEEELIRMASVLGYPEVVLLACDINYKFDASKLPSELHNVTIKKAYLLKSINELARARKNFDMIFAVADRIFFESKVDYIIGSESSDRKDSVHYRATSLNQVHASLAKDAGATIVFSFNSLLACRIPGKSSHNALSIIFGRMMQNAVLVQKYRLGCSAFSMAREPQDMRSRAILDSFEAVLGI